ncbi:hypothetical protein FSP39_017084 [Pinctada imbricata]|uniref:Protein kinase domain-containing protein n=1 Tax=Pinctada imbricata TaxID=66713 RepID=A0AA88Y7W1_PINIB|nr:hypothetical protein FSP39_017084 [Pinctada imbricata]
MNGRPQSTTVREFMHLADFLCEKGYRIGPTIGEGTHAKVKIVERTKDGKILALKIVNVKKANKDYVKKFMPRELKLVLDLVHPNIIATHQIMHMDDQVFFVMDYAQRGDLLSYIKKRGMLEQSEAKKIFIQLAKALEYLHTEEIAHRDLKCENVLMMADDRVVLTDFGFARSIKSDDGDLLSRTFCGSSAYASPELVQGIPYDPKPNDVWGLGCILYIMICGKMPFDDRSLKRMLYKQLARKIEFPDKVSAMMDTECKTLIYTMLEPAVEKRMSITQVLMSEWLKEKCLNDKDD